MYSVKALQNVIQETFEHPITYILSIKAIFDVYCKQITMIHLLVFDEQTLYPCSVHPAFNWKKTRNVFMKTFWPKRILISMLLCKFVRVQ